MTTDFIPRHIGPNANETAAMLQSLGASSLEEFIEKAVPAKIRSKRALNLPEALSEREALSAIKKIAPQQVRLPTANSMETASSNSPVSGFVGSSDDAMITDAEIQEIDCR